MGKNEWIRKKNDGTHFLPWPIHSIFSSTFCSFYARPTRFQQLYFDLLFVLNTQIYKTHKDRIGWREKKTEFRFFHIQIKMKTKKIVLIWTNSQYKYTQNCSFVCATYELDGEKTWQLLFLSIKMPMDNRWWQFRIRWWHLKSYTAANPFSICSGLHSKAIISMENFKRQKNSSKSTISKKVILIFLLQSICSLRFHTIWTREERRNWCLWAKNKNVKSKNRMTLIRFILFLFLFRNSISYLRKKSESASHRVEHEFWPHIDETNQIYTILIVHRHILSAKSNKQMWKKEEKKSISLSAGI